LIGGSAAGGAEVALGATLAVASAVLYDVGYVLEKQALLALPSLPAHPFRLWRVCVKSPRWLAGFVIMLGGLALQLIALTLAPVTVVQPILAAGVLGVAAAGRLVLGERLGPRECVALVLVAVAVAAITVSAVPGAEVARGAAGDRFLVAAVPAAIVALTLFGAATRRRPEAAGARPGSGVALTAGSAAPQPPIAAGYVVDDPPVAGRYGVAALAVAAGLLYGIGAVAEKAVATGMVDTGITAGFLRSLSSAYPWAFVVATLAGMVAFQIGLQRHHASMVVPLTNVISGAIVLVGASVVFSERLLPSGWWALPRLTGFAGVLAAVLVLAVDRSSVAAPALA
jgi:hypothetical protein